MQLEGGGISWGKGNIGREKWKYTGQLGGSLDRVSFRFWLGSVSSVQFSRSVVSDSL